jgi:hypothetical protein
MTKRTAAGRNYNVYAKVYTNECLRGGAGEDGRGEGEKETTCTTFIEAKRMWTLLSNNYLYKPKE